jgi:predicted HTH transcriptional regulator
MPGITLDDVVAMRVTSVPRNPVLAGFLRDVPGYMERIGSGIRFMISEMRALGLPVMSNMCWKIAGVDSRSAG